ncbi:unnamed protein product, partial [Lepidochelys olivacea]
SDSGAPNVWETAQGTVSWGSEDGIPPGVYTSVSIFIPWIQETMKRLQPSAAPGIAALAGSAPLWSFGEAQT